ncbi:MULTISPECIES: TniQ family protein [unclassified Variovorax]|uniref:TniQ family protein n=1 Tax=unclassified Variovorax TaxID=663243 RepID=UPI0034E8BD1B
MSDEDRLINSPWVWPRSYWRETESAWMCAHKFGFLNALHGVGLRRALADRPAGPTGQASMRGAKKLFSAIAEERARGLRPGAQADVLRAYTMNELFFQHAQGTTVKSLRYCPECLRHWFHASLFQLAGVEVCPFHGLPLRTGCPSCGASVDIEFMDADFRIPMFCARCAEPFAGRPPAFIEVFGRNAADSYEPAQQMAALQRGITRVCGSTHFGGEWAIELPFPAKTYLAGIVAGHEDVARPIVAAQVSCPSVVAMPCSFVIDSAEEPLDQSRRTIKAIGRYLGKLVRRHCGHRAPPSLRIEVQQTSFDPEAPCWLIPATSDEFGRYLGVCACCFVLARWRVLFAETFASSRYHQRIYPANYLGTEDDLSHFSPQIAFTQFSRCAVQVAYGMGFDLSVPGSHDWIERTDTSAAYRQVWPSGFNHVRLHRASSFAIGYSASVVTDVLARLAGTSMLPLSKHTAFPRADTDRAIWGQSLAELKSGRWHVRNMVRDES